MLEHLSNPQKSGLPTAFKAAIGLLALAGLGWTIGPSVYRSVFSGAATAAGHFKVTVVDGYWEVHHDYSSGTDGSFPCAEVKIHTLVGQQGTNLEVKTVFEASGRQEVIGDNTDFVDAPPQGYSRTEKVCSTGGYSGVIESSMPTTRAIVTIGGHDKSGNDVAPDSAEGVVRKDLRY